MHHWPFLGMSTRKGNIILLEEVLDEAFKRVRESLDATPTTKVENRVEVRIVKNKPDRATMRPGCVSACIDHVTYV